MPRRWWHREEEDTRMAYEEEDTCMSYEEEDTCLGGGGTERRADV
jgi:hypothetical protein